MQILKTILILHSKFQFIQKKTASEDSKTYLTLYVLCALFEMNESDSGC
jgi:hypothetical protein